MSREITDSVSVLLIIKSVLNAEIVLTTGIHVCRQAGVSDAAGLQLGPAHNDLPAISA
jgi:hypothetical protein